MLAPPGLFKTRLFKTRLFKTRLFKTRLFKTRLFKTRLFKTRLHLHGSASVTYLAMSVEMSVHILVIHPAPV
jgi:hypothetical protein